MARKNTNSTKFDVSDVSVPIQNQSLSNNLSTLITEVFAETNEQIKEQTKEAVDNIKETINIKPETNIEATVNSEIATDIQPEEPKKTKRKTKKAVDKTKENVEKTINEITDSEAEVIIQLNADVKAQTKQLKKVFDTKRLNENVLNAWSNNKHPVLIKGVNQVQNDYDEAFENFRKQSNTYNKIASANKSYSQKSDANPQISNSLRKAEIEAEKRLKQSYVDLTKIIAYGMQLTTLIEKVPELKIANSDLAPGFNSKLVSNKDNVNYSLKELPYSSKVISDMNSSLFDDGKLGTIINTLKKNIIDCDTKISENKDAIDHLPEDSTEIAELVNENKKQWVSIIESVAQIQTYLGNDGLLAFNTKQLKRIFEQTSLDRKLSQGYKEKASQSNNQSVEQDNILQNKKNKPQTSAISGNIFSLGKGDGKDNGLISNLMLLCKYAEEASIDLLDVSKAKEVYNSSDDKEGFLNNVIKVLKVLEQIKISISDINSIYKELPTESSEKSILEEAGTVNSQGKYSFNGKFNKTKSNKPFSGFISSTPTSRDNIRKSLYNLLQEIVPNQFQDIKSDIEQFNISDDEKFNSELLKYFDQERNAANTMNEAASSFASSAQDLYDKVHSSDDNEYTKYAYNKNNSEEINKKNKEALQKSGRNLISKYLDLDSYEPVYEFAEKRTEQEQNDFIETYILNLNKLYKILELLKGHKATIDNLSNASLWNGSFKSDGSISLDDKISISREDKNNNNIASYIRTFYSNAGIEVDKSQVENSNRKKIDALGVVAVQDKEINELRKDNNKLQNQNRSLQEQNEELSNSNKVLREIAENKGSKSDKLQNENTSLQQNVESLNQDVNDANEKIAQLEEKINTIEAEKGQKNSENNLETSSENNKPKKGKTSKRSKSKPKTTETTNENSEIEAVKTEGDIVEKTVDQETQNFKSLENSITDVTKAISEKTNAVVKEGKAVSEVVQKEIDNFQKLEDKVKDITEQINNINGSVGNIGEQSSENKPKKQRKKDKKKDIGSDNNSNNDTSGEIDNSGEEKRLVLDLNEIKPELQEKVGKFLNDYVNNLDLDGNKSKTAVKLKNSKKGITGTLTRFTEDQKDGKVITKTLEQNFEILETATATASKNVSDFAQEIADGNYVLRVKNETVTYGEKVSTDNKNQNKKNENRLESLSKKINKVERDISSSKINRQDSERLLGSNNGNNEKYSVAEIKSKIENLNNNPNQVTKADLDDIENLIEALKTEFTNNKQAVTNTSTPPSQTDIDIYNEKWNNRSLNLAKLKEGLISIGKYDSADDTAETQELIKDLTDLENLLNNNKDVYDKSVLTKFDAMLKTFNTKYLSETIKKQQNDIEKVNKDIDDTLKRIYEINGKIDTKSEASTISEQDATRLKKNLTPKENQLIETFYEEDKNIKGNENLIVKKDFVLNIKNLDDTKQNLKSLNNELDNIEKNLNDIETKSDFINKYANLSRKVQNFYDANSNIKTNKELDGRITNLINSLNTAIADGNYAYNNEDLDKFEKQFDRIRFDTKNLDLVGKNFADSFKQKFDEVILKNLGNLAAGMIGNYFRQMVNNVKEIDTAMTELKKVTNETSTTYNNFLKEAGSRASDLGATMTDLISSTADFAKLGYSVKDAAVLAENAIMYSNVGDLDIQTATSDIVSALKAFDIEASNAIKIVDSFNEVGNNYAISAQQIGEALQNSASSLVVAGNDIDQSIAMITAMTEITQDASSAGIDLPDNMATY